MNYRLTTSFRYRRFCTKAKIFRFRLSNFTSKKVSALKNLLKKKVARVAKIIKRVMRKDQRMQQTYGDKKIEPLPLSGVKFQYRKVPIPELNNSRR